MDEVIQTAITSVLDPSVLVTILLAAAYGIFVGAVPGLTATMAVALMVPLTFYLSDIEAVAAIVTTVTCSIFAGDLPAVLVRIPGTPASAAYTNDAYAFTLRGEPERALAVSVVFSVLGGLFGTFVLVVAAPLLARLATQFTSYEYFWLYLLGLTCAAIVSQDSRLKGALALLIGLLFSTVGLGTDYSVPRLTFDIDPLITGISFIPAMIGLFGVSEVLRNVLTLGTDRETAATILPAHMRKGLFTVFVETIAMAGRRWIHLLRSSSIGAFIGMLPGAGADIAAWISYAVSKRFSKKPEEYGRGSLEGLADATGANDAALGGAWIPALVFGIPGDSITAIVIGVLMMKNITPGPGIFDPGDPSAANYAQTFHATVLVFSIYAAFVIANLILIPLGLLAIRVGTLLIRIPRRILLPVILMFCIVGSYSLNANYVDVWIMLAMGLVGFVLEKYSVPLGPVVLGILLGGPLEHRFIQCLQVSPSPAAFFAGPISIVLAIACLALWFAPSLMTLVRRVGRGRPE
jgi:TctA family transporter